MSRRYLGLGKGLVSTLVTLGADLTCPLNVSTPMLTLPVPAGSVAVGDTFEFKAFSNASGSAGSFSLEMAVGSADPGTTVVWATTSLSLNAADAGQWFRGLLTVKTIGASGTVMGGGEHRSNNSTFANETQVSNTNATQVVDTTAPWFITARAAASAAASGIVVKSALLRKVV